MVVSALCTLAIPGAVHAQRAAENAVTDADDAFGISVGLESAGIYTDRDTRGFSPLDAGNARIDGIYYDPVSQLTIGLEGEWTRQTRNFVPTIVEGKNKSNLVTLDLVTVFRF